MKSMKRTVIKKVGQVRWQNNGNYCKRNEGKELSQTGDEIKMNIHKDKMLWYNTSYCIRASYERS